MFRILEGKSVLILTKGEMKTVLPASRGKIKKVVIISIYWTGKGEKVYAKRWKYMGSNLISQI